MPSSPLEPVPPHTCYEDMSECNWRTLGAEWDTWMDNQDARDFYLACKTPTQPVLFTVEFNGNTSKRVTIPLVDALDFLLLNESVKDSFVKLLAKSTCIYSEQLRAALAHQYAADNKGEHDE